MQQKFVLIFRSVGKGDRCTGRRAKPGRFGSLAFALKNKHFGGECSQILAGKARKCGRFWVFACAPNPGKQSIWRQCPPSARKQSTKKLPNRPGFTHVQGAAFTIAALLTKVPALAPLSGRGALGGSLLRLQVLRQKREGRSRPNHP